MSANLPEALFTVRLRPLADRLDANQVLATATAIYETPSVLTDSRLEGALLEAIYAAPSMRLLLAWPDGSMGFAYLLHPTHTVAEAIATAYTTARAALEALHLQDAAPAGAITH
jgi:hypothetical protein